MVQTGGLLRPLVRLVIPKVELYEGAGALRGGVNSSRGGLLE